MNENNKEKKTEKITVNDNGKKEEAQQVAEVGKSEREEALAAEINRLHEEKLRLLADSENQRRSFQQTNEYTRNYSNRKIILWLLDFLTDLEKALEFMRQEPESQIKKHLLALEMIKNNLEKNLTNEGVREIKIELEKDQLNSRYHEAVAEVANDNLPTNTILEVVKKGYLLHQQVLKASQVKISKKAE